MAELMKHLHIYTSKGKYVDSIPYRLEDVMKNPYSYYPNYLPNMILTHTKYDYPIIDEKTGLIREMTEVEQVQSGQRSLKEGEIIFSNKIQKVPVPYYIHIGKWDFEKMEWVENASEAELREEQKRRIDTYKADRLAAGYQWRRSEDDKTPFIQKARDKDIVFIGSSIDFLNDCKEIGLTGDTFKSIAKDYGFDADMFNRIVWSFDDSTQVALTEQELRMLRIAGSMFTQIVFNIEALWKNSPVDLKVQTYEKFAETVDENYTILSRTLTKIVYELNKNK